MWSAHCRCAHRRRELGPVACRGGGGIWAHQGECSARIAHAGDNRFGAGLGGGASGGSACGSPALPDRWGACTRWRPGRKLASPWRRAGPGRRRLPCWRCGQWRRDRPPRSAIRRIRLWTRPPGLLRRPVPHHWGPSATPPRWMAPRLGLLRTLQSLRQHAPTFGRSLRAVLVRPVVQGPRRRPVRVQRRRPRHCRLSQTAGAADR